METARHNDPSLLWAPRRQLTLEQARARSAKVDQVRRVFVAAAAISICLFLGYILRSAIVSDARPPQIDEGEAAMMKNPRFTGRDSAGNAFTITAAAAERKRAADEVVDLVSPLLIDEKGSEVSAPSGTYDREKGVLELFGDVRITDSTGYTFLTRGARVYMKENRVQGLSPLMGKGPMGDVRADSYEILDGGRRILFKGRVRTVLYPEQDNPAEGAVSTPPAPQMKSEDPP
jgi:lipopolysaccharide export system protein LptC